MSEDPWEIAYDMEVERMRRENLPPESWVLMDEPLTAQAQVLLCMARIVEEHRPDMADVFRQMARERLESAIEVLVDDDWVVNKEGIIASHMANVEAMTPEEALREIVKRWFDMERRKRKNAAAPENKKATK